MSRRCAVAVALLTLLILPIAGCLGTSGTGGPADTGNDTETNESQPTIDDLPKPPDEEELGHVHTEAWSDGDTRLLVDRSVPVEAIQANPNALQNPLEATQSCDGDPGVFEPTCLGRAVFRPDAGEDQRRIVPPGTGSISAEVSWSEGTITGAHLWFRPAYAEYEEWRTLGQFAESGESARVESTKYNPEWTSFPLEWTDDGHAEKTRWMFAVSGYAGDSFAAVADGEIDVTIKVHRTDGELPLEPPHPDWYGNASSYRIAKYHQYYNDTWEQTQVWWFNQWYYTFYFEPWNPIPPGTEEIVVAVNKTNESPTTTADETSPQYELYYWWNGIVDWGDWPPGTRITPDKVTDDQVIFRITPKDHWTDSVYACSSSDSTWGFVMRVRPKQSVDDPIFGRAHTTAMHYDGKIEIDAAATQKRGAAPADLNPQFAEYVDGCELARSAYG